MRKLAVVVLTALALTGCASTVEPVAPVAPVEQVETVEAVIDAEQIGFDVLRDMFPTYRYLDDAMIRDTADAMCEAFDAGASFETVVLLGVAEGLSAEDIGGLTGFATAVYCPEHAGVLDE